ncbi:nucleotide disphospho-sugar-binding domain-containing protein [Phormidesmis sp. 146-12]
MAKFLIGTIPVVGHVSPALSIVRELVNRGHEVCWYTGSAFQAKVESTGARFAPIASGLDYSYPENVPQDWTTQRNALRGAAQLKFDLKHFFIDAAVGQVKDLTAILQDFAADVLLTDFCFLGAAWIHEQGGPPWAGFGISALAFSSRDTAPFGLGLKPDASPFGQFRNRGLNWLAQALLFREVTAYTNQVRADLGLPHSTTPFFDTLSPFLHIAGTVPEFEYPRRDLPAQVHFVGPLLSSIATEFTPPAWWDDLKGSQPVVHVTQGTVATDPDVLIVPTLRALAQEEVLIVATTIGKAIESLAPDAIPANARIESFIPHSELLPHVDVMITNGGYNGVQMALAAGVPLVAAGQSEDKPEVCARIEWAGVGIDLKTGKPTPEQIRAAVKKLLSDRRYQTRAKDFQRAIRQYDAPMLAATRLEQLAITKQPVIRTE